MISAKILAKQVEKFALDNAPIIFTAVGAVSAVGATVLTGKATLKAAEMIQDETVRREMLTPDGKEPEDFSTKDKIKFVWKEYIPAAGVLVISVTSIISANRISTRRAAAMAAAYSLSEKAYSEYREKVVEKFNANKEQQIRDELAQDRVTANPPPMMVIGNGDVICYDQPTGRYFKSNVETIRQVQNDVNAHVNEYGHATLSDFYVALKLKETPMSEEIGWTPDRLLDVRFSTTLTDDNQPCLVIDYTAGYIRGVGRFQGCIDDPGI